MKSLKLKKLVAATVAALTIASVTPVGASAAWRQDSNGWWNTEGYSYSIGWRLIDGDWYYFDSVGYMKTGWVNDNGTWYYLQSSGAMKTGWVNDGGTWYYLQSSGAMKTGWVNDGGTWYYLQPSGAMKTGWINDNGTWYFASSSGAMQTGVVEVDGKVYYLAASGAMQTGSVVIDGVTYNFAPSGEAIGDKIPTPTLFFTSAGVQLKAPTDTDKTTTSSGGGSHHSSGGSSSNNGGTTTDAQQAAIDTAFAKDTKVTYSKLNETASTVTVKASVDFTPGESFVAEPINGVTYTGTKNVYITFDDGTDVGLSGDYNTGYTIQKGKSGTIKTVITLYGSDNTVKYVTPQPVAFSY